MPNYIETGQAVT